MWQTQTDFSLFETSGVVLRASFSTQHLGQPLRIQLGFECVHFNDSIRRLAPHSTEGFSMHSAECAATKALTKPERSKV